MRVVIVNDFGHINGGAAKVAITSAEGLARAGVPVTFFCAMPPLSEALRHPGITVECLGIADVWAQPNPARAAVQAIWNRHAKARLGALLAGLSPRDTVVHFHHWTRALSPSVLAAAAEAGFPVLITLHDYFSACPNGAYYDFRRAKPCTLRPLSQSCIARACDRRSYVQKLVRLARQVATNLAVRQHSGSINFAHVSLFARAVIEPYLWPGAGHFLLANPIDVERPAPAPAREFGDFVFVGRFTVEKGTGLLAEATRLARVPITYVGGGELEPTIRSLNPSAKIVSWAGPRELTEILRRARALVFPSLWFETSGLVVGEALARGVPAIVSCGTAAADLIRPGRNGLLFEQGELAPLVDCLHQLSDDATAARMGEAAFETYWREPQSIERHVWALRDIYRALLPRYPPTTEPDGPPSSRSDRQSTSGPALRAC